MKILLLLLLAMPPAGAQMLDSEKCGAALRVPAGWEVAIHGDESDLVPVGGSTTRLPRRIHLVFSKYQDGTIVEAINHEIDAISERSKAKGGSSNDRNNLFAIRPVQTTAGLPGFVAEFAWKTPAGPSFSINKFYFRNAAGKIFGVCAHVYGDQQVANDFQGVILDNLVLMP